MEVVGAEPIDQGVAFPEPLSRREGDPDSPCFGAAQRLITFWHLHPYRPSHCLKSSFQQKGADRGRRSMPSLIC